MCLSQLRVHICIVGRASGWRSDCACNNSTVYQPEQSPRAHREPIQRGNLGRPFSRFDRLSTILRCAWLSRVQTFETIRFHRRTNPRLVQQNGGRNALCCNITSRSLKRRNDDQATSISGNPDILATIRTNETNDCLHRLAGSHPLAFHHWTDIHLDRDDPVSPTCRSVQARTFRCRALRFSLTSTLQGCLWGPRASLRESCSPPTLQTVFVINHPRPVVIF